MIAEERPPEHDAWVYGLPEAAAAALTVGQLASWPPAALWRRLTMLVVKDELELGPRAWAWALADRCYPHPHARLARPAPSDTRLAEDLGVNRTTARGYREELEDLGWIIDPRERRKGRNLRTLQMAVPDYLVRVDGLLSEEQATRGPARLRRRKPAEPLGRFDPSHDRPRDASGRFISEQPAESLGRQPAEPLGTNAVGSNAKPGLVTGNEEKTEKFDPMEALRRLQAEKNRR